MKKAFAALLAAALLLTANSCSFSGKSETHGAFYYCRKVYRYHQHDGVIASEARNITDMANDLPRLLALFFLGPQSEELEAPFPASVKLVEAVRKGDLVQITLAGAEDALDSYPYVLGCACLAMTALELSGCNSVEILCGESSLAFSPEDLLRWDDTYPETALED